MTSSAIRWRLAWVLVMPITLIMSLDRTAMTVSAPIIQKEMHFTLVQMSWILTAFHWAYAAFSIPAGILTAYCGARIALLFANAAWSVLTLAIPFAKGAASLIGLRFALGGFQAADMPASITAFKSWFPTAERARANAILLTGVYLGPILGAPLTVYLVAGFGWRIAFIAFGLAGIVSALAWALLFRNRPEDHWSVSQAERDHIAAGQVDPLPAQGKASLAALAARGAVWTIGLQGIATGVVMGFFNTWLPTFLMQAHHVALKSLGFFSSLPWMILLLVVGIAALIADAIVRRSGSIWLARVPAAIIGFLIAAFGLWLAAGATAAVPALLLLAAALGGMGFVQVSTWATIQEIGGAHTSILTAWNGMLTNGAAALGPLLMAEMVQRQGNWSGAMVGAAGAGLIGACAWTMIHPRRPAARVALQRQ